MKKGDATVIPLDNLEGKDGVPEQKGLVQNQSRFKTLPLDNRPDSANELPNFETFSSPRKCVKDKVDEQRMEIQKNEVLNSRKWTGNKDTKQERLNGDSGTEEGKTGFMSLSGPNSVRVKTPEVRGDKDTKFTECPFSDFGCTVTGEAIQIRRHIRDESALHLSQMCDVVLKMSDEIKTKLINANDFYDECDSIIKRVHQVSNLYSSQFLWRITNYSESFANARRGQSAIIYSSPFFSHRQGYKLAAAMALYGDGDAIGEFNSVFITILRGEHDAILPWPFRCPIKFTLINLKNGNNIEATITPHTSENNMPFLGRPHSDRNPAFGFRAFADLRMMTEKNGFVANDSCFLRIDVNLETVYKYIG